MRLMLGTVEMQGVVVIGEEKDEAPMLYNGEEIAPAGGTSPSARLEGTRLTALGQPNAIAVIAVAERGTMFFPGAAVYMDKIAVGPEAADGDLDRRLADRERARGEGEGDGRLRRDRGRRRARPTHCPLIAELREAGARVNLIRDGGVAPSMAAAQTFSGVDVLMGIGGTPEGVISPRRSSASAARSRAGSGRVTTRAAATRRRRLRCQPRAHAGRPRLRRGRLRARPASRAARCCGVRVSGAEVETDSIVMRPLRHSAPDPGVPPAREATHVAERRPRGPR